MCARHGRDLPGVSEENRTPTPIQIERNDQCRGTCFPVSLTPQYIGHNPHPFFAVTTYHAPSRAQGLCVVFACERRNGPLDKKYVYFERRLLNIVADLKHVSYVFDVGFE